MDTSIHIYGHLSDGILHHIERENTLNGTVTRISGNQLSPRPNSICHAMADRETSSRA